MTIAVDWDVKTQIKSKTPYYSTDFDITESCSSCPTKGCNSRIEMQSFSCTG